MPLQIIHRDITTVPCDVIVNPTDRRYSGSGGTDRAIHRAAGPQLRIACDSLPQLACGEVQVTAGFGLPCKYILHTMGPRWLGGSHNESVLLRSCYVNSLLMAQSLGAASVAFPLIASGTFGFPKDQVLHLAQRAISDFLAVCDGDLEVFLCILDRDTYELPSLRELEHLLCREERCESPMPKPKASKMTLRRSEEARKQSIPMAEASVSAMEYAAADMDLLPCAPCPSFTLEDWIKQQDDSFAVMLLKLIDRKGMTDVQCYKKANVSKKTFWKINNDAAYRPSKPTVIAFAIALRLTMEETQALLKTVGFTLSRSNTFDMIIEYYIQRSIYDIHEINAALYKFDQPCLGC